MFRRLARETGYCRVQRNRVSPALKYAQRLEQPKYIVVLLLIQEEITLIRYFLISGCRKTVLGG